MFFSASAFFLNFFCSFVTENAHQQWGHETTRQTVVSATLAQAFASPKLHHQQKHYKNRGPAGGFRSKAGDHPKNQ